MPDITKTQWENAVVDTEVKAALTALTIPAGMEPAEFLYKLMKGYRAAQVTANAGLASPNLINVISAAASTGVQIAQDGSQFVLTSHTLTVRLPVDEDSALAPTA